MTEPNKPGVQAANAVRQNQNIPARRPAFLLKAFHALTGVCLVSLSLFCFPAPATAADDCIPVKTAVVDSRDLRLTVGGIGTLEAVRQVMIRPEINGLLESVHFEEGNTVEKGELLYSIDDNKIRAELDAKQAALEESLANLDNARRIYQRRERLFKQDLGTEAERDEAQARYKALSAQVERIKAEIEGTREALADTRIKAPFAGLIGERHVDPGEWVSAGTGLSPLVQIDRLKIAFTVPEKYAGRIETGQQITARAPAAPEKEFDGTVYFVSPVIREDTRSFLIKAHIDNPEKTLLPGGFASVNLVLEVLRERPVIPEQALIPTRDGYMVFVVDEDGKARGQTVSIGLRKLGFVEITEGLSAGETVIRAGHISVKEGDPVCEKQ